MVSYRKGQDTSCGREAKAPSPRFWLRNMDTTPSDGLGEASSALQPGVTRLIGTRGQEGEE